MTLLTFPRSFCSILSCRMSVGVRLSLSVTMLSMSWLAVLPLARTSKSSGLTFMVFERSCVSLVSGLFVPSGDAHVAVFAPFDCWLFWSVWNNSVGEHNSLRCPFSVALTYIFCKNSCCSCRLLSAEPSNKFVLMWQLSCFDWIELSVVCCLSQCSFLFETYPTCLSFLFHIPAGCRSLFELVQWVLCFDLCHVLSQTSQHML